MVRCGSQFMAVCLQPKNSNLVWASYKNVLFGGSMGRASGCRIDLTVYPYHFNDKADGQS